MGLWCSLLGHRFEEPTVEQDRQENGDEIVTVTREVERCARCGTRRIVAENTEVTAVESAPDQADGTEGGRPTESAGGDRVAEGTGRDDVRSTPSGTDAVQRPGAGHDGAEILTDDDREPGEWPAEPDATAGADSGDDGSTPAGVEPGPSGDARRYRCPDCGFTDSIAGSPHRAGDSCPECRAGYLETE